MKNNLALTKTQGDKFLHNLLLFLAPLGILYLTTIIGVISQPYHNFKLNDLIPNQVAVGGMILYVLNTALDYLRKIQASQK
jgi:hypothetical protein